MHPSKEPRYSEPVWWTVEHTVIWEEHLPSLRADFKRRAAGQNRAQLTKQGPDDLVFERDDRADRHLVAREGLAGLDERRVHQLVVGNRQNTGRVL